MKLSASRTIPTANTNGELPKANSAVQAVRVQLRLRYAGRERVLKRRVESITLGRDASCTFVVADPSSSRQHCVIERRQGKRYVNEVVRVKGYNPSEDKYDLETIYSEAAASAALESTHEQRTRNPKATAGGPER